MADAFFSGFIGLLMAAWLPVVFRGFRTHLGLYPRVELLGAALVFATLLIVETVLVVIRGRTGGRWWVVLDTLPYSCALVLFIVLTPMNGSTRSSTSSAATHASSAPIYMSLALLALLLVIRSRMAESQVGAATASPTATGLATTSVLIVDPGNAEEFLLVLNRNLNAPKGLWVSPGGHFDPDADEPCQRLLAKIQAEVGMIAHIVRPSTSNSTSTEYSTTQTKWLTPPSFLLDEDLFGRCSRGHLRHLDFVYVCEADGEVRDAVGKYGPRQRIRVPVRPCATSVEDAERAVHSAIARWHMDCLGENPGVFDTVTRDLSQRLHLVARERHGGLPSASPGSR